MSNTVHSAVPVHPGFHAQELPYGEYIIYVEPTGSESILQALHCPTDTYADDGTGTWKVWAVRAGSAGEGAAPTHTLSMAGWRGGARDILDGVEATIFHADGGVTRELLGVGASGDWEWTAVHGLHPDPVYRGPSWSNIRANILREETLDAYHACSAEYFVAVPVVGKAYPALVAVDEASRAYTVGEVRELAVDVPDGARSLIVLPRADMLLRKDLALRLLEGTASDLEVREFNSRWAMLPPQAGGQWGLWDALDAGLFFPRAFEEYLTHDY
jgi:hypothetical protein